MSRRSGSSAAWLARQRRDPYVGRAASRAFFKLQQLDARFGLTGPAHVAVELGAAPGGWTEYLAPRCRMVVACDVAPLARVPLGARFVQGDAFAAATQARVQAALQGLPVHLVLSDLAPNLSGNRARDQALHLELLEGAAALARRWLQPGGRFVAKLFQGAEFDAARAGLQASFQRVSIAKPPASRASSSEVYAVACLGVE